MLRSIRPALRCALAISAVVVISAPAVAGAAPKHLRAGQRHLAEAARSVAKGEGLVIEGLVLEGQAEAASVNLERYDVWGPGAQVEVDGQRVTPPATVYFRGAVGGDDASVAMIAVRASGEVQGFVQRDGRSWLVGKGRNQRRLHSKKADESQIPPFACGNEDLASPPRLRPAGRAAATAGALGTVLDQARIASVAIETDYEYYARFGNTAAALDYMADLIGYADLTYSREVKTDLQIGYARLWTTGAANDPWAATSGTSAALTELRSYWNANMTSVKRTLVHMLSGKGLGGGIAWLGVLCDNYGYPGGSYDYGLSASLGTNFNWDGDQTHNPSSVVWDIIVVQHEIGHNFDSPHAHDYCNIGGSSLPIDNCWDGCQAGATVALPSCTGPTPWFTSGGGAGTIMSYCHQRSGGYGNIAMTFGKGHTCGTLPGREADRMANFVTSSASYYSTCFAKPTCGNGTIDAGEQCDGANLSGATCSGLGYAGGTLSCSPTCTLVTSQCTNCGNNQIDAGETCDGSALGSATCAAQGCSGGFLTCNATCNGTDASSCTGCPLCNHNAVCEAGEDCGGCPSDCASGTAPGASCGNGKCEAGNGEDCLNCAADCNGVQSGKTRYCCGDGSGTGPIPCTDSRCTAGGRTCTTVTAVPTSFCCGNLSCEKSENCSTCSLDCAGTGEICGNGIDDNCNGKIDCADSTCAATSACVCLTSGMTCTANSQCCSGTCKPKGNRKVCN